MTYIVEKEFKLQEKMGDRLYEITLDSPGYNQPINHFYANCKVGKTKKIAKLRMQALQLKQRLESERETQWTELKLDSAPLATH